MLPAPPTLTTPAPASAARPQPSPLRWVPVFVVLACLVAVAVTLPIVYNLRQQMRPEALAAARALWAERGPADYDLEITLMLGRAPAEHYAVWVRGGRVALALGEGEVLALDPAFGPAVGLAVRGAVTTSDAILTVDGVLDRIAVVQRDDPGAGTRNLLVAVFDPHDGHPRRFVHRVRGTDLREEWVLRLSPPGTLRKRAGR